MGCEVGIDVAWPSLQLRDGNRDIDSFASPSVLVGLSGDRVLHGSPTNESRETCGFPFHAPMPPPDRNESDQVGAHSGRNQSRSLLASTPKVGRFRGSGSGIRSTRTAS